MSEAPTSASAQAESRPLATEARRLAARAVASPCCGGEDGKVGPQSEVVPLRSATPAKRFLVRAFAVVVALATLPLFDIVPFHGSWLLVFPIGAAALFGALRLVEAAGKRGARHVVHVLFALLVLAVLPLLGLRVDAAADACTRQCDPNFRPLAIPEVFGLVPLQVAAAGAYFLSLRRPEALGPRVEAAIAAALLAGVVLHLVLGVQFIQAVPLAIFVIPLPILTPYLTVPLLLARLVARLRDRGRDVLVAQEAARHREPSYREPATAPSEVTERPLHWGHFARGIAGTPLLLGLHAVVMAAVFHSPTGGIDAFLHTCSYPLSRLPIPPTADCHYLCTIAAQGSPSLVKPYRWGVRRGQPIVVNRQLALANAFEDLLHERWPRFGALARRTYDALALPLTRVLCRRWAANALYLVMKPAEWIFFVALLFLDPGDPEARVDRMYR